MEPRKLAGEDVKLWINGALRTVHEALLKCPFEKKLEFGAMARSFRVVILRPRPVMGFKSPWWGLGLFLRPVEIPQPSRFIVFVNVGTADNVQEFPIISIDVPQLEAMAAFHGGAWEQTFMLTNPANN